MTVTGSTATGVSILRTVAPRVRPVSLELGGKNAALVFADANMDEAIDGLTRSLFTNAGQVCLCTERVYIQRPVFDEVVSRLADSAKSLRLGRPGDPETTMGPLISQAHREKLRKYVELADEPGVTTVVGGGIPDLGADLAGGWWLEPTLWTGLTDEMRPVRRVRSRGRSRAVQYRGGRRAAGQRALSTGWPRACGPRTWPAGTGWLSRCGSVSPG